MLKKYNSADNWNSQFQAAFQQQQQQQNTTENNYTILADTSNDMFDGDADEDEEFFVPETQQYKEHPQIDENVDDVSQDLLSNSFQALIRNDEPSQFTNENGESQDVLGTSYFPTIIPPPTAVNEESKEHTKLDVHNDTNGNIDLFESGDEEMSELIWETPTTKSSNNDNRSDSGSVTPDLIDIPVVSTNTTAEIVDENSVTPDLPELPDLPSVLNESSKLPESEKPINGINDVEDDLLPTQLFTVKTPPLESSHDLTIDDTILLSTSTDEQATQQFVPTITTNPAIDNDEDDDLPQTQLFVFKNDDDQSNKSSDANIFTKPLPPPARKQKKKIIQTLVDSNIDNDNDLERTQVFLPPPTVNNNKSPDNNAYDQLTQVIPKKNQNLEDIFSLPTQKFIPPSSYQVCTQQLPQSAYTVLTQQLPSSSEEMLKTPAKIKKNALDEEEPCTPQFDFLDFTKNSQVVRKALSNFQAKQNDEIKSTNPIFIESSDDDNDDVDGGDKNNVNNISVTIKQEKLKTPNKKSSNDDNEIIKQIQKTNKDKEKSTKNKAKHLEINKKKYRPSLYSDDSESSNDDGDETMKFPVTNLTPKKSNKKISKNNLFGDSDDSDNEANKTLSMKDVKMMKSCQVKLTPTLRNRQMKANAKRLEIEKRNVSKSIENQLSADATDCKLTVQTPPLPLRTRSKIKIEKPSVEPSKRCQDFTDEKTNKRLKTVDIQNVRDISLFIVVVISLIFRVSKKICFFLRNHQLKMNARNVCDHQKLCLQKLIPNNIWRKLINWVCKPFYMFGYIYVRRKYLKH